MKSKHSVAFLMILAFFLPACDASTKSVTSCGDGFLDPGEQCDTDTGGATCSSLGHYNALGTLRCTEACLFDVGECGGRCGDGIVDAEDEETCDGANLQGASCLSLGYYGGTLACGEDCRLAEEGCALFGRCGDDEVSAVDGEVCDGSDLAQETCESLGYHGGQLACAATCLEYDLSGCVAVGRCGDGVIQEGHAEDCDGAELAGQTCESLGYHGGVLACSAQDCIFDETDCAAVGRCGDGFLQAAYGETCDGADLGEADCLTLGFYGGSLVCTTSCVLDTTGCEDYGRCGDAVIQDGFGEVCEAGELNGVTCQDLGFHGGQLACGATCMDFDTSGCAAVGRCGDGIIQAEFGEVCDGAAPAGETCQTLGYYGGVLACAADCTLELTDCMLAGRCGDGINQGGALEDCDGDDLDGAECHSLGYHPGVLACGLDCRFDTSGCAGRCGDAVLQSTYEECDQDQLGAVTCESEGWYAGTLACGAACLLDFSACGGRCGDGIMQDGFGEVCDGTALGSALCLDDGKPFGVPSCVAGCEEIEYGGCRNSEMWGNSMNNRGTAVAVDASSGAVYVAGRTQGSLDGNPGAGGDDAFLTKYSPQGTRLWTRQWGTFSSEYVGGVAIGPDGAVYVVGWTEGAIDGQVNLGANDVFLSRFDSDGVRLWTRLYGTTSTDYGYAVVVDPDGEVYITGSVSRSFQGQTYHGSTDAFLARLGPDGDLVWARQWGSAGLDAGRALSLGPAGLDVAGSVSGPIFGEPHQGQADVLVSRYALDGTRLFTRLLGSTGYDHGWGVVQDVSGGVVVAGEVGGQVGTEVHAGGSDAVLARYDATGALLWVRQWGSTGHDQALGVVLHAGGDVLVCGKIVDSIDGQPFMGIADGFLSRFDGAGQNRTSRLWGSAAEDTLASLAPDGDGNLFLAGAAGGSIEGAPHQGGSDVWLLFVVP